MGVLLNVDLGELPDEPEELYRIAHVVNVACGGHAGDEASMRRALGLAKAGGAIVMAHPSYPDRAGFGRRTMAIDPISLRDSVSSQCETLARVAGEVGVAIEGAKPHGALYHDAVKDVAIASAVLDALARALPALRSFVGPPSDALAATCASRGLRYVREGFADRAYRSDGSLVPRTEPGALLVDPASAAAQARNLLAEKRFDTLCVHGDTPGSVAIARAVRAVIDEAS